MVPLQKSQLIRIAKESPNLHVFVENIGLTWSRQGRILAKTLLSKYNLRDIYKDAGERTSSRTEYFQKNSGIANQQLKEAIIDLKLQPYKCEHCGCDGIWQGKPIMLQLDHKDGDNQNNTLENLRFLCPNCHSQTETHSVPKRFRQSL